MPYNFADFLQAKWDFRGKTAVLRSAPFGGLSGNVRWSYFCMFCYIFLPVSSVCRLCALLL